MITGIGIDLIEVDRIAQAVQQSARFRSRLFTAAEIAYCDQQAVPAQHYAARYAAKEAFFKALGTGYRDGLSFQEIEIVLNELGRPAIRVSGKCAEYLRENGIDSMQLSLTHTAHYACAVVVMEKL